MKLKLNMALVSRFLSARHNQSLSISAHQQQSTQTCWAACYKTVDLWKNVKKSYCTYVNRQSQQCEDCWEIPAHCNRPRETKYVQDDWKHFGYPSTEFRDRALLINEVRRHIKKAAPIQAYIRYKDGTGHYFLIVGTEKQFGTGDAMYVIADPLKGGRTTIEISQLQQLGHWQKSWIISK